MDLNQVVGNAITDALTKELQRFNDAMLDVAASMRQANLKLEFYTVKETAQILKTSVAMIYKLIDKQYLKALNIGGMKISNIEIMKFEERFKGKEINV